MILLTALTALLQQDLPSPPESLPTRHQTDHFDIRSDLTSQELEFYGLVCEGFRDHFEANYYRLREAPRLPVYLFSREKNYAEFRVETRGLRTPCGYYLWIGPDRFLAVVNLQVAPEALTHELTHHFVHLGFDDRAPCWFNQGLAQFFETYVGYISTSGKLVVSFGYVSKRRFPAVQRTVESLQLRPILGITDEDDDSPAGTLMLFLHRRGLLKRFVESFRERNGDTTGNRTLEKVWGGDRDGLERELKDWIRSQPDEEVRLVPSPFVKTEAAWKDWWEENKRRLVWDEREKRYRPTTK